MPAVYYAEFFPDLHFQVRVYDAHDDKVSFLTCAATDIKAAHLAYENAMKENPDRPVRLMQWGRVLRETHRPAELQPYGKQGPSIRIEG